jgi:hypothetical protein
VLLRLLIVVIIPDEVDVWRWVLRIRLGHHRHPWGCRRRSLWWRLEWRLGLGVAPWHLVHLNGRRARRRLPDGIAPGLELGRWRWRRWRWQDNAARGRRGAACGRGGCELRPEAQPLPRGSNVSIIFDAPCLFLHHLPIVSLHLVAFLYIFRN